MVVMTNEKGCDVLRRLHPAAQCAWTSYLDGAPGAAKWGYARGTVYWVWIMRWHVRGGLWGGARGTRVAVCVGGGRTGGPKLVSQVAISVRDISVRG